MKLAKIVDGKLIIGEIKEDREQGVFGFDNLSEAEINTLGYYLVETPPDYDSVMQILNGYELIDGRARRTVVDKVFGTLEEEKEKKKKEITDLSDLANLDLLKFESIQKAKDLAYELPQELIDQSDALETEKAVKLLEIDLLETIREVVSYE